MSSLGLTPDGCRCSSSAPLMNATPAKNRFTYSVHRQDRYSVSAPPSSRPTAPPATAIAPNTPNALARSFGSVNVVTSTDSAEGTSSAANAPWQARGHQHGEIHRGAADGRDPRETDQPDQERHPPTQQVSQPATQQQQAAERQRVGGDHPLPVHRREVQRPLGRWQRDIHDRQVQDHHQLRQANHAQDQAAPSAQAAANGSSIRRHAARLACRKVIGHHLIPMIEGRPLAMVQPRPVDAVLVHLVRRLRRPGSPAGERRSRSPG